MSSTQYLTQYCTTCYADSGRTQHGETVEPPQKALLEFRKLVIRNNDL